MKKGDKAFFHLQQSSYIFLLMEQMEQCMFFKGFA